MNKLLTLILIILTVCFLRPTIILGQAANINDSIVLLSFFNSKGLEHKGPVSTWSGITLSAGGRVKAIKIELYNTGAQSAIPSSLGNLDSLESLQLSGNQLTGTIPQELGNLTKLVTLNLSVNKLKGSIPASLGNLVNLRYLILRANQLSGSIPSLLGRLTNLQEFDLSENVLSDSIPSSLGLLSNLETLDLWDNQLTGRIPSTLGNLTKLISIYLFQNKLTGGIPSSFGNLVNLKGLFLNYNQLNDTIPSSLGRLSKLQSFRLEYNQLKGNIPVSLGNLTQLTVLYLNSNKLTGTIPSSLGNLTNLTDLDLGGNQLGGNIPKEIGNLTKLEYLTLYFNKLNGLIPAELGNLKLLLWLRLSNNQLAGSIPAGLCNNALRMLILNDNLLSGFIPTLGQAEYIAIQNNHFTFSGMENILDYYVPTDPYYSAVIYAPQHTIPLHFTQYKLHIFAGGHVSNNTYTWWRNGQQVKITYGDSAFVPTLAGRYRVSVTNKLLPDLTLYSDTITLADLDLPVTLLNFTGQATHDGNQLNWQTASEINSAYFNVQYSTDGLSFKNIGRVGATGNSTIVQNYSYTHALAGLNSVPTVLYYRLQEVDRDGTGVYSKVIALRTVNTPSIAMVIYPNPVHGLLEIKRTTGAGTATVTVTDITGKILRLGQIAEDAQTLTINVQDFSAGVYIVRLAQGKNVFVQKFVKE